MSELMAILLNGISQLEYDRGKPLPIHQEACLDKMDRKMDEGIRIGEETIRHPDQDQRVQFIAANLLHALNSGNESMAVAMCTYLANRMPELKQVRIEQEDGEVSIELVFDEEYRKQVAVEFTHIH